MDDDIADRASQEIKELIRKLDPRHSSHNDRSRRLTKFRNFVTGEGVSVDHHQTFRLPLKREKRNSRSTDLLVSNFFALFCSFFPCFFVC